MNLILLLFEGLVSRRIRELIWLGVFFCDPCCACERWSRDAHLGTGEEKNQSDLLCWYSDFWGWLNLAVKPVLLKGLYHCLAQGSLRFNPFILGPSNVLKEGASRTEFIGLQLSRALTKNVGCIYKGTLRNKTKNPNSALAGFEDLSGPLLCCLPQCLRTAPAQRFSTLPVSLHLI